jgi:hypothetical protein
MPTLPEIKEQIQKLDGTSRLLGRKEIKELPSILWEDESVEKIVQGFYDGGVGVLVATNKRLVFVDKRMTGIRVEDFPYGSISTIQYKTGMLMGKITVFASGNKAEIDQVGKKECRDFSEYVRARVTAPTEHASVAAAAPADPAPAAQAEDDHAHIAKIERLAALRDSGALTPEEFDAQKQRILDQMV